MHANTAITKPSVTGKSRPSISLFLGNYQNHIRSNECLTLYFLTSDANHIFLKTTFFILGFHPKPYTLFQGGKRVEKRLAETMLANASAVA